MRTLEFLECIFIFVTITCFKHNKDKHVERLKVRLEFGSKVKSEVGSKVRSEVESGVS